MDFVLNLLTDFKKAPGIGDNVANMLCVELLTSSPTKQLIA